MRGSGLFSVCSKSIKLNNNATQTNSSDPALLGTQHSFVFFHFLVFGATRVFFSHLINITSMQVCQLNYLLFFI